MSQRTDRVDELLRQEIGVLLAKEIADPRIGFVTIRRRRIFGMPRCGSA